MSSNVGGTPEAASLFAPMVKQLPGHDIEQTYVGTENDVPPSDGPLSPRRNSIRDQPPERGNWSGKMDFLMSMIAYAVGLGNVWRFPYLCYDNGGGAFFIPYFLCWLLAATPIFFMEVSVGQFLGEGGISAFKLVPIFKGVGWANQIIASMCNIYYCVIVAWAFFFVVSSFRKILPWATCDGWWNDNTTCYVPPIRDPDAESNPNITKIRAGVDYTINTYNQLQSFLNLNQTSAVSTVDLSETPVEQFWERRVLQTTKRIEEGGYVQWELCLMMIAVWVFTYFALWKGITNSRKMIYFCAICPYILLIVLLIRGARLDGAIDGIYYYLKPNLTVLATTKVWKDAGTQIFYSFGIGFGTLIALGSYNKYHHNVYRDAFIMCCINSCTSILAGFVVFSVLGNMAYQYQKTIDQVAKGGVGLAFLVYPEAIVTMPLPQLWSVLFFMMIMLLGLDSQVVMVEGVITALADQFPLLLRHKKIFVAVLCAVGCLLAMPMVTQSGQYWLQLMDNFGASGITLLFVVFFEIVALSWGFGAERIYDALEDMLGFRPFIWWLICWKYLAPVVTFCIFVFILVMYEPLKYSSKSAVKEQFPDWAQALGLLMSISSMVMIPGYAIYFLVTTPGTLRERLRAGITPAPSVMAKLNQFQSRRVGKTEMERLRSGNAAPNNETHTLLQNDRKPPSNVHYSPPERSL